MAERGRGAAGRALPSSPGPVLAAKGALRAGAGEGGGGGRPGPGRARCDSAGVSNGDCSLGAPGGEARVGPALAAAPSPAACPLPRDSKPGGLPRRSSIIKMIQSLKALIENADAVYEKIVHCQKAAMEFHEHLHSIGTKEGLKERKLQKAVESFTWNITILKGQADLLKYAKNETVENLKQIHYAAVSCGLSKPGTENADVQKPRRSLEVIPEKASDETGE